MDIFDSSSDSGEFLEFDLSEIVVREVDYDSGNEFGDSVSEVSSVHTSDISDWESSDCEEFSEDEWEGSSVDGNGWKTSTSELVIQVFVKETGPNVAVMEPTQLAFFYQLFEERTFVETTH